MLAGWNQRVVPGIAAQLPIAEISVTLMLEPTEDVKSAPSSGGRQAPRVLGMLTGPALVRCGLVEIPDPKASRDVSADDRKAIHAVDREHLPKRGFVRWLSLESTPRRRRLLLARRQHAQAATTVVEGVFEELDFACLFC
jgi:hypothetical protein